MRNVIEVLKERGLIEAISSDELQAAANKPLKVYIGFDPTADSLHIGHLVGVVVLAWFQRLGHTAVALVGGATGMVGDPSGKSLERPLLDLPSLEKNVAGIRKNLEAILDFSAPVNPPLLLNNYDWLKGYSFIEFMRDIGRHFRLGPMLAKESVRARMESEEGMSLMEFVYQTLQSYDFLHLNAAHEVTLQAGGSDQWGNITAGIELVRKLHHKSVYGLTFPLLTRSDGKKFGKTEEGAIWLSPEKLSPYHFYQYLIRVPDADVITMMKRLTFLDLEEIKVIEEGMLAADYQANSAQKRLAEEVTRIVHGDEGVVMALRVTEGVRPGSETELDVASLQQLASEMPTALLDLHEVVDRKFIDILVETGLVPSKGEARRLIRNGGVYCNNGKITDENGAISRSDLIDDKLLLLSVGKRNKMLICIKSYE